MDVRLYGPGGIAISPSMPTVLDAVPLATTLHEIEGRTVFLAAWDRGRMVELMVWNNAEEPIGEELHAWMRMRFQRDNPQAKGSP